MIKKTTDDYNESDSNKRQSKRTNSTVSTVLSSVCTLPRKPDEMAQNNLQLVFLLTILLVGLATAKVYERCELARELKNVHKAPAHQLATWVCIAKHESGYNTKIVSKPNANGSRDHGLFQVRFNQSAASVQALGLQNEFSVYINDKYWCSPPGTGKGCGQPCSKFEDDKIADDYKCVQTIYSETKRLKGDGFKAWSVYEPYCKGSKADAYIKGCF